MTETYIKPSREVQSPADVGPQQAGPPSWPSAPSQLAQHSLPLSCELLANSGWLIPSPVISTTALAATLLGNLREGICLLAKFRSRKQELFERTTFLTGPEN